MTRKTTDPKVIKQRKRLVHHFALSGNTVTQLKKDEVQLEKYNRAKELLRKARAEVKEETLAHKRLKEAVKNKPAGVKMTLRSDGKYYCQTRNEKGQMQKAVCLNS